MSIEEEKQFIVIDSSADGHCCPRGFCAGACREPDEGPASQDAQQKKISFDVVARVPMVLQGSGKPKSLESRFREGATVSKTIMSLMMMADAGAEFGLSKQTGCQLYIGGDYESLIELTRQSNTLGMEVNPFENLWKAKSYAHDHKVVAAVAAEETEDVDMEAPDTEGSTASGDAVHEQPEATEDLPAKNHSRMDSTAPTTAAVPPMVGGMALHPNSRVDMKA